MSRLCIGMARTSHCTLRELHADQIRAFEEDKTGLQLIRLLVALVTTGRLQMILKSVQFTVIALRGQLSAPCRYVPFDLVRALLFAHFIIRWKLRNLKRRDTLTLQCILNLKNFPLEHFRVLYVDLK
jgi:hypothetical protein